MLTFKLDDRKAKRVLRNLNKGISDFKPALELTRRYQLKEIENQYKTEGSNILGSKWQSLKRRTILARIRAGFGAGPILTASGKMRKSHRKKVLNKNTLGIENTASYYKYHQQGSKRIPQRQVVGHSNKMIKDVVDIFVKYLRKIMQS